MNFGAGISAFLKIDPVNQILEADKDHGELYLGNIFAAYSEEILTTLKIGAVLTVADHTDLSFKNRTHKVIKVEDQETENLGKYFDEMVEFIEENRRKMVNVLVHCFAGVSRSSSAVIAYLMKYLGWDYSRAFSHCKRKRFVVYPNSGFVR